MVNRPLCCNFVNVTKRPLRSSLGGERIVFRVTARSPAPRLASPHGAALYGIASIRATAWCAVLHFFSLCRPPRDGIVTKAAMTRALLFIAIATFALAAGLMHVTAPISAAPEDMVEVCHSGGTLLVAPDAVNGHIGHGDSPGPCADQPTPTATPTAGPTSTLEPTATPTADHVDPRADRDADGGDLRRQLSRSRRRRQSLRRPLSQPRRRQRKPRRPSSQPRRRQRKPRRPSSQPRRRRRNPR